MPTPGSPSQSGSDPGQQDQSSGKRRKIVRSRNGCGACRKQRKKCDEVRPLCRRCAVSKRVCSYPQTLAESPAPWPGPTQDLSDVGFGALAAYASTLTLPVTDPPFDPTSSAPENNEDWTVDLHALFAPTFPSKEAGSGTNVFTLPETCEDSIWSAFMESSIWTNETALESNRSLFQYYTQALPQGIVFRDGSARHFYSLLASRADSEDGEGIMHAVLALAAQHKSNISRMGSDLEISEKFADVSLQHRTEAFHFLRTTAAEQSDRHAPVIPVILILLILTMALKGESGIVPFLLKQTQSSIFKASGKDSATLPTVAVLHFIYSAFYSLGSPRHIDPDDLYATLLRAETSESRVDEILDSVVGLRKEALLALLKANMLVQLYQACGSEDEAQTAMNRLDIQSKCSLLQTELDADELWERRDIDCSARTKLGHLCTRLAGQVMLLTEVLDHPSDHPRVRNLVRVFSEHLQTCAPRMEVGLTWPYIIVAPNVERTARSTYSGFIRRAQWKGSAMPILAEKVILKLWEAQDKGEKADWREIVAEMGSPLII